MSTLPDNMKCRQGHTFAVPDDRPRAATVQCPVCGDELPLDVRAGDQQSQGRSLWSVMQGGNAAVGEETLAGDSSKAEAGELPVTGPTGNEAAPQPRSRWSVVESTQGDSAAGDPSSGPVAGDTDSSDPQMPPRTPVPGLKPVSDRPRGLWAMMEGGAHDVADEVDSSSGTDLKPLPENSDDEGESLDEILGSEESETEGSLLDGDDQEEDSWQIDDDDKDDVGSPAVATFSQRPAGVDLSDGSIADSGKMAAVLALSCGVAALLLAGFNLLPDFWAKIPSTAVGLGALVWSYQSFSACKRSPDRKKIRAKAGAGLACGLIGMFAGPMFLNAAGDDWRAAQLRLAITRNLDQIGESVDRFYEHRGEFPRATYKLDEGADVPLHSWMSALLPHTDYAALALKIERGEPYNAPANYSAMSTVVPLFLVPNVEHQPTLSGLATAHFAGVGGETLTAAGQVDVGVFSRGATVRRDMLTDGASQTMLAGEITRVLPAWGEPGNWRTIGRGLNRQVSGFGNASGTGAHFLMADGSVKLFPNSTSRDVLVKLSTRNGEDPVSLP